MVVLPPSAPLPELPLLLALPLLEVALELSPLELVELELVELELVEAAVAVEAAPDDDEPLELSDAEEAAEVLDELVIF